MTVDEGLASVSSTSDGGAETNASRAASIHPPTSAAFEGRLPEDAAAHQRR